MTRLHPSVPRNSASWTLGHWLERDVLLELDRRLPDGFELYHSVDFSLVDEQQRYGEVDLVVLSPTGHLLLVEIKSGQVLMDEHRMEKTYAGGRTVDVVQQTSLQRNGLRHSLDQSRLQAVKLAHLLVLPDQQVDAGTVGYPRERIVAADEMDQLAQRVLEAMPSHGDALDVIDQTRAFLCNRFRVAPDPSFHMGMVAEGSRRLADGLAIWVPRIHVPNGLLVVESTAGSGKTQLALALLQEAHERGQRAAYFCFNRPLADHVAHLAPPRSQVSNFHELCIETMRRQGQEPDFNDPQVFNHAALALRTALESAEPRLDLLVIDESQDFEPAWVETLSLMAKPEARVFLMGDPAQALYQREEFGLPEATVVRCDDNFRTPQRVVDVINLLQLTPRQIQPRSPWAGDIPEFLVWKAGDEHGLGATGQAVDRLLKEGIAPADMVLLSWRGLRHSALLHQDRIAGHALRRFTGRFDPAGNAQWTEGTLLAETVMRFKGQSAPVVVLCEVDFDSMDDARSRLFVGLTRANWRVVIVLSPRAHAVLERELSGAEQVAGSGPAGNAEQGV
ncbi:MAG TPA: AAA family ATPase [Hydrogenophaga sp.]|uniref:nuclease-related domain-containing DEAD/DEAH box helicase n=1 Tax=Hydrogenophaga sp. TaxID=1904254 RepID=UPI002C6C8327|nr:NERD domain-containing protein [Hydrogenophaga sp.]HMN92724.1 AAA family ATPase [Hydrogenophaga sp.]HMP08882.1 AAA family ATPase [Hydrogenophaga sp.]